MPLPRRYGLRTVAVSGDGATGRRLVDHLLQGRKTAVLRPLIDQDGSTAPLERPGELLLAVDHAGRSVAVLRVDQTGIAVLDEVEETLRRADDPDAHGHTAWLRTRRQEWSATGHSLDGTAPMVWIRFHVMGRDDPDADGGP